SLAGFCLAFFLVRYRAQPAKRVVVTAFGIRQPRSGDGQLVAGALILALVSILPRLQFLLDGFQFSHLLARLFHMTASCRADCPGCVGNRGSKSEAPSTGVSTAASVQ